MEDEHKDEVTYLPMYICVHINETVKLQDGRYAIVVGRKGDKVMARIRHEYDIFELTGCIFEETVNHDTI